MLYVLTILTPSDLEPMFVSVIELKSLRKRLNYISILKVKVLQLLLLAQEKNYIYTKLGF